METYIIIILCSVLISISVLIAVYVMNIFGGIEGSYVIDMSKPISHQIPDNLMMKVSKVNNDIRILITDNGKFRMKEVLKYDSEGKWVSDEELKRSYTLTQLDTTHLSLHLGNELLYLVKI